MRSADNGPVHALDLAVGADDARPRCAGAGVCRRLVEVLGSGAAPRIDRGNLALAVGRTEVGERLLAILTA